MTEQATPDLVILTPEERKLLNAAPRMRDLLKRLHIDLVADWQAVSRGRRHAGNTSLGTIAEIGALLKELE